MNKPSTSKQYPFLPKLIVFSLVLFALHTLVLYYLYPQLPLYYPLWIIYAFHFITVFSIYTSIKFQLARGKKKIFYTFMAFTFIKMALAVVFMLPLLFSSLPNKQPDVFNFFIPYFLFLAIEVTALSRFLKRL